MTQPETDGYEEKRHQLEAKRPKCSVNLQPMEEWIREDAAFCRPCILPVTIDWYKQELTERGRQDLADELDQARMTEDPEAACRAMDDIKNRASVDLRYRLMEFDCSTQEHATELEEEIIVPDEASPESSLPVPDSSGSASENPPETSPPEHPETEL